MRRAITWDADGLKLLRDARDRALAQRLTRFTADLGSQGKHDFNMHQADETILWLEREFAANPPIVYPENREGREP